MACVSGEHDLVEIGDCTHSSTRGAITYHVLECTKCGAMGHKPAIFMDFSKRLTRAQLAEVLEREEEACPIERRKRAQRELLELVKEKEGE